jgi:hypothetical protein
MTVTFPDNTRDIARLDDTELRKSMETFGWVEQFPAIKDQDGTVLVGHRRLKIAAELGIPPVAIVVDCGNDPERWRIAIASNIGGEKLTKADRQRIGKILYDTKGMTLKKISHVFGVSEMTISRDLFDSNTVLESKPHPKTASNPKGSGRRKGSGKPKNKLQEANAPRNEEIVKLYNAGQTSTEIGEQYGITNRVVSQIVERADCFERGREQGRQEAYTREDLSPTAQQKFDAAVKRIRAELEAEITARIRRELDEAFEATTVPYYIKRMQKLYDDILRMRVHGFLTRKDFKRIQACLHTDGKNLPEEWRNDAFNLFTNLESMLLSEAELQTPSPVQLPTSVQGLMALRRQPRLRPTKQPLVKR